MLTSSGGSLNADRGRGGDKICQNLADVICERSLIVVSVVLYYNFSIFQ